MPSISLPAAPALRRGPRRRGAARIERNDGQATAASGSSSRPLLATLALGGLAVFAVTGALANGESATRRSRFDRAARRDARASLYDLLCPWAPRVAGRTMNRRAISQAVGDLGGKLPTLIAMSLASVAIGARRGVGPALPMFAAIPLVLGTSEAVKPAIRRPRPWTARLAGKKSRSFPSGHAARAVAAAGVASHVARREGLLSPPVARSLAVAIPLAVGASRIHVDRHWATDVVGGWGLGAAAAALCALWYDAAASRVAR